MLVSGFRKETYGQGLIFLTLLVTAYAVKADVCSPVTLGSRAGLESSEWTEFSDAGARVVRETGHLRSTGLVAGLRCSAIEFGLDSSRSQGQRHYVGVTNRQNLVETVSDIDSRLLSGDLIYSINSDWAVGLKAEQRTTHRTIRTTSEAAGYPERFESLTFFSGARYRHALKEDLFFSVEGWLGRGGPGTVWLDLPNAEPAELALGRSHAAQVGITFGKRHVHPSGKGWDWSTQLNYSAMTTHAGPQTALFRAGRVVAVANQPKTEIKTVGLYASVVYSF